MWTDMCRVIPEGESGNVRVHHYVTSEVDTVRSMCTRDFVQPGKRHCVLYVDREVMMSDTRMEQRTNFDAVRRANGHVLIAGLGLGMILVPILAKPEVRSVTVLEKNPDVIALVEPHLRRYVGSDADKLTVIEADCFAWKPPKGAAWHTIYLDIWPDICTDNLAEVTRLKRRFARRVRRADGGWMGAWNEARLRYQQRRENRANPHLRWLSQSI